MLPPASTGGVHDTGVGGPRSQARADASYASCVAWPCQLPRSHSAVVRRQHRPRLGVLAPQRHGPLSAAVWRSINHLHAVLQHMQAAMECAGIPRYLFCSHRRRDQTCMYLPTVDRNIL